MPYEYSPGTMGTGAHHELQILRIRLSKIHDSMANYQPLTAKPPIIDSSLDLGESSGDRQWLQQENIPGLKNLMEAVKRDLDVLDKFLADPKCASLPAISTNAPYVIAVWNELLCGPPPILSIFKSIASTDPADQHRGVGQKPPGVKVDVVADNGKRWIRVNTVKTDRMLAEFREIDSYLTDSEDDPDNEDGWPTLAQTEFDNSVLRLGRSLIQAAKANPVPGTTEIPQVTMCLTRLDPSHVKSGDDESDPRIAQTIQCLADMGIDVQLGERGNIDIPPQPSHSPAPLEPSTRVNLDLSVLIALISDLTHSPLPPSSEQANARFVPSQKYREWKKQRLGINGEKNKENDPAVEVDGGDIPRDIGKHSRALTNQVLQETGKGLLQELSDRLSAASIPRVEFWTTPEARGRCLRIVSKIGGPNEQRRANALFCSEPSAIPNAEEEYWRDSRYPKGLISFLPIHLHPSSEPLSLFGTQNPRGLPPFFKSLAKTCRDTLAQETIPHPWALPDSLAKGEHNSYDNSDVRNDGEIQRATVMKANPRLTAHTVQSMLWGAELGWTTLTANKTSVKAILREMKATRVEGRLDSEDAVNGEAPDAEPHARETAAIWVVDPRSLAEGMRSDAEL